MPKLTTFQRVAKIIAEHGNYAVPAIRLEDNLQFTLKFDSLDRLEVIMGMEDEFSIEIADEDGWDCKTVADLVALIDRLAK